jgi:hypothetical protein
MDSGSKQKIKSTNYSLNNLKTLNKSNPDFKSSLPTRVVDPYSFFTDPDPELDVGGQYGSGSKSGSGSESNTDPGL